MHVAATGDENLFQGMLSESLKAETATVGSKVRFHILKFLKSGETSIMLLLKIIIEHKCLWFKFLKILSSDVF